MSRPSLPFAALFTPIGFLGLTGMFAATTALLIAQGATPEAAGIFALAFVMGTGEAFLHVLDKGVRRLLDAPGRRAHIAQAKASAQAEPPADSH